MRVLIDVSYLDRGRSGTAVYIEQLLDALRERNGVEVVEARQGRRLRPGRADGGRRNPLRSAANALLDAAWLRVRLPRAARRVRADVLHHPLPARLGRGPCAQVVTLHDVGFERLPDRYDSAWRALARGSYRAAVRRAQAVVCPSQATARDAAELLGAPPERLVVAPHGPGQPVPSRSSPRERPAHFLYVGDAEPRKNLDGLLAAYASYREAAAEHALELVLAGGAASFAAGTGVRGETDVAPDRLGELLGRAAALVHPSLHEGFGLTLLEAMSASVPVVAVRNPATEEICGESAFLVEPGGLSEALGMVQADAELRERLARSGRERASAFSWGESALLHERAYRLAMDSYPERAVN